MHLPGALPTPALPTAASGHGQRWGTGPAPLWKGTCWAQCPKGPPTPALCTALLPANPPQPLTGAGADVRHVDEGSRVLDQSGVMQRDARAEALGVHRLTELRVGHRDGGFVIPCGKKLQLRPLSLGRALLQAPAAPRPAPPALWGTRGGRFALLLAVLQPGLGTGTAWGQCACLGARWDAGPRPSPRRGASAVLTQLLDALLVLDEELDPRDVDVQAGALRRPLHRRVKAAVILAVR